MVRDSVDYDELNSLKNTEIIQLTLEVKRN